MTVIVSKDNKIIVSKEKQIQVISVATQGPPGPTGPQGLPGEGSGLATRVNFSYGDATPSSLLNLITGKTLIKLEVYITTPFDGTNPYFTIGKTGDSTLLMNSTQSDSKTIGQYATTPLFSSNQDTIIYLYLYPDFDTNNGAGFILIYTS